ncbi:cysteine dioxygenase family protein [Nonomuraea sp. NPDC050394]|uniref:Putative metal-dependent enzyme (Double-stranded beta helix superfamily) n=1 Tax=Nonomuraea endophytica TaxID=714136 RepID=A0A7W7ZVN5_9ACTN|nr:cysteine dioxygenase family protein [Nonomuraea endophytica]MBB5074623.1 putative metal-dependent enzyme (double-stranded beta helix superfamily) [Nonomuraea endophytica]
MEIMLARPGLDQLVSGIRDIVAKDLSPRDTAFAVADFLRLNLPGLDVLTDEERAGDPETYRSFPLHTQEEFSVVAVVWRPGQQTRIHDHVSWCTFGILSGVEYETLYRDMGDHLVEIGRAANQPGEVSGFAPPGDIHKVENTSDEIGVSLHVYGADVGRLGSSVRRYYDLPIR